MVDQRFMQLTADFREALDEMCAAGVYPDLVSKSLVMVSDRGIGTHWCRTAAKVRRVADLMEEVGRCLQEEASI